ncbi:MAG: FUSC family protein [Verrucomicrobiales bacterium]|nr:FUSC family protein [Verrucomicrobiales bacterium]
MRPTRTGPNELENATHITTLTAMPPGTVFRPSTDLARPHCAVNRPAPYSAVAWENRLLALIREELAPSPTRWRSAIRLTVLCVLGTALITASHMEGGQFMVLMFFLVAMSDAPTSKATLGPNLLGCIAGGGMGVAILSAFADKPAIRFPLEAVVIAGSMYLVRATTVPMAMLFFDISFVIAVPEFLPSPGVQLYDGVRAVLFQTVGIAVGTLVQILWWPENPESLLLTDLAESLRSVADACRRRGADPDRDPDPGPLSGAPIRSLRTSAARLFRQLDLLREAEAGDRWLRQGHTEQIKFITDIQLLVFAAQGLDGDSNPGDDPRRIERLARVRRECERLAACLRDRRVPETTAPPGSASSSEDSLTEMERILSGLPSALVFLAHLSQTGRTPPTREPLSKKGLFLPLTPEDRRRAIQYGVKVGIAASLCGAICQALSWPGISGTCVLTTVLVAQATVGLSRHKSALRFGGALVSGLAVLVTVDVFMPNMESLASLLTVIGSVVFVAAWIGSGSTRLAYFGVQIGVTLYLILFPRFGPTLDLVPIRDRLIGILLGIVVMAVVDALLWPVFTRSALRVKVAGLLRTLSELRAVAPDDAGGRRESLSVSMHRGIAEVLTLQEEMIFETTTADADAENERQLVMRAINRLQALFLSVLKSAREGRPPGNPEGADPVPAASRDALSQRLDLLAEVLEEPDPETRATRVRDLAPPGPSATPEVLSTESQVSAALAAFERDVARITILRSPDPIR